MYFLERIPQLFCVVLSHLQYIKALIGFNLLLPWSTCSLRSCFHANHNQSLSLSLVVTIHTNLTLESNRMVDSDYYIKADSVMAKVLATHHNNTLNWSLTNTLPTLYPLN